MVLLAGCPKPAAGPADKPVERPLEGLKLRIAVIDDPALASAVKRISGEWNAQTGAELQVEQMTEKDLAKAETLPADAMLCPSHLLGDLAERKLLAPVPPSILHDAQWGGIFELLKLREAAWAHEIMAVPFGSPVFCCYYRADLLEKLHRRPPKTWAEYQDLAKLLAEKGREERGEGRGRREGLPSPFGRGAGGEGAWSARSSLSHPAGRGWCYWPGPRPTQNTATTTRHSSTSKRWSRWWPAHRSSRPWRSLSPRPNLAPPIRSVTIRRRLGRRSGRGNAG